MKFTKHNNPNKKRYPRKRSQVEKDIAASKAMLIDKKLGYEVPLSAYES